MKNLSKVLALVLVVAMVFSLAVSAGAAASFKDSASVNYTEAVQLLAALDVLNGYDTDGDGKGDTFKPGANITRAELTVMLSYLVANEDAKYGLYNDINKLNKDYKSLCTFADSKNEWAAGFIAFCYGNGYISGRDADTFDPNGDVTVAEATVMLLRVMGYDAAKEEFGTSKGTVKGYNLQLTARNAGLLDGLDDVDFFAPATREQVAQLFMNALDAYTVSYTVTGARVNTVYNYAVNTVSYTDYQKLVNVCFEHVLKVNTTNEFGYAGHQWVTYPNAVTSTTINYATLVTYTGAAGKLTDVVVDDAALASFKGGTSYASIAASLGLTSATSTVPVVVYVNGAQLDANGNANGGLTDFTGLLPGAGGWSNNVNYPGTLNAIYTAGVQRQALPDNCTLSVVRDYDRSVGGTYYKLMYNFEFVATIALDGAVTNALSPRYGQYQYTVSYYKNATEYTDVVYAATNNAYAANTFYIVVPNESTVTSGSNYPNVSEYNAFLTITPAVVVAPFTATSGSSAVFANNTYISDGTSTYYVSRNITDFVNTAAYRTPMGLVQNTAGFVAAYVPVAGTVLESGYVYVDSLEFSETVTAGANWINQYNATWSAQAKAQVYFPAIGGNSNYTVIDLAIYKNAGVNYVDVATANWGAFTTDTYVDETAIVLKGQQTQAFYDSVGNYTWTNNFSNIRVYDKWFDGWYVYTKNVDGTYSLAPVGTDKVDITKGNANVANLVVDGTPKTGYTLTSATEVYTYTMNLATKTATAVVQTAYKGIASDTYGGEALLGNGTLNHVYTMPKVGVVGGEITLNTRTNTISKVDEFVTDRGVSKYAYTLYKGNSGFSTATGTGMKFLVGGGAEVLYAAPTGVYYTGIGMTNAELKTATQMVNDMASLVTNNLTDKVAFELTVENGYVTAIKALALTKAENVAYVDANGYIRLTADGVATNYNVANVWNFNTGAVDAAAKGDTAYYVTGATGIAAMWVVSPFDSINGTPNWNTPNNGNFQWWS